MRASEMRVLSGRLSDRVAVGCRSLQTTVWPVRWPVRWLGVWLIVWLIVATTPLTPTVAQDAAARPPARENFIGVFAEPVSPALAAQFADLLEGADGVVVRRVVSNSPAASAGIAEYDVLVSLDGTGVRDVAHLKRLIAAQPAGAEVPVVLIRRAQRRQATVRIGERPRMNTPRAPAGIQVRNDRQSSNPLLEVGPDGVKPLEQKTSSWSLAVLSLDGQRYRIVVERDSDEDVTLTGSLDELRQQAASELPRVIADEVRRLIDQLQPRIPQQAFRFRLQPRLEGTDRILRISLLQPGRSGAVRMFEMDHHFGDVARIDAEQLLELEALREQLQHLTPGVRRRVERTLRDMEIPPIQVQVRGSL